MLLAGSEFLWEAFWELTTERRLGFGAESRIPHSAIRSYARDHGYRDPDTFSWFLAVIREMDAEYLGIRAPAQQQVQITDQVAMTDFSGIKALLRRLAKKPTASPADQSGS